MGGAWSSIVHGLQRVGQDFATKQQEALLLVNHSLNLMQSNNSQNFMVGFGPWSLCVHCPSTPLYRFKQSLQSALEQRQVFFTFSTIIFIFSIMSSMEWAHFTDVRTENRSRFRATITWHLVGLCRWPWQSAWNFHCCPSYVKRNWF